MANTGPLKLANLILLCFKPLSDLSIATMQIAFFALIIVFVILDINFISVTWQKETII